MKVNMEQNLLLTHSFIEYLTHPDRNLSDKNLLEIGSGHSTIFWASYFRNVYSYECDYNLIQKLNDEYKIPDNVKISQIILPEFLTESFKKHICSCDYIIIDNNQQTHNTDVKITTAIIKYKKEDSQIILDNGTWNINAYRYLRDEFFCRDFPGTNMENQITVTSLFFEKITEKYLKLQNESI